MNWDQLKALLWLRWRLTRNQWAKGNPLALVVLGLALIAGIGSMLLFTVGGFTAGYRLLEHLKPSPMLMAGDIFTAFFLFMWMLGLVNEIQRSEAIDFQRLMHLPISLPQLFLLNFVSSLFTPTLLIAGPAVIALSLGATLGNSVRWILLTPLALGFFFMIAAWTYCLRGWLVSLMVNPRRRRTIATWLTISVVLLVQGPNLYYNVFRMGPRTNARSKFFESPETYGQSDNAQWAHRLAPPLWLAAGAQGLREKDVVPALLGTAGLWILGGLGLRRAYRSTLRYYQGFEKATAGAKPMTSPVTPAPSGGPAPSARPRKPIFLEWQIPGLGTDSAGMALMSLRSMLRAPEMKMALFGPFAMVVFFSFVLTTRFQSSKLDTYVSFIPPGMLAVMGFGLFQLFANQFGFDRHGFRSLALLPTPRENLLLGRNLAFVPFIFGPGLLILVALPFLVGLPVIRCLSGFFQLLTLFCILCTCGNLMSIGLPYRINTASLKPTKQPGRVILMSMVTQMLFPLMTAPLFVPPLAELLGGFFIQSPGPLLNLAVSIFVAGAACCLYTASLAPLGRWFERREKTMLSLLTEVTE